MSFANAFRRALLVAALTAAALPAGPLPRPAAGPPQTPRRAAPPPAAKAPPPPATVNVPFRPGEIAVYSISWRLFTAGEARMRIDEVPAQPALWQATITAISTGFVSKLFNVEDKMVSTFERTPQMCSVSLLKTLNEGRRHREIKIDFLKDRKVATLRESDPAARKVLKQAEHKIPGCAYDVVSALFYVRSVPLEVGRSFQISINDGGETLPITVEVQEKEDVKTEAGTFHTVRVEPRVFSGMLFRHSGRLQLWFTDDSQRQLVQLRARLFVGTISAVLQSVQHK